MTRKNPILTKQQNDLLSLIAQETYLAHNFYLAGGTTLSAFYLHHRLSDDLDLFTKAQDIDTNMIFQWFTQHQQQLGIQQRTHHKRFDRNIFGLHYNDNYILKVEFSKYFHPLYPLQQHNGIQLESKEDILIDKIACIYDRQDPKDYFDLYYLYQDYGTLDWKALLKQYSKKFGNTISLRTLGYSFSRAKTIKAIPHILDKNLSIQTIQQFFNEQTNILIQQELTS